MPAPKTGLSTVLTEGPKNKVMGQPHNLASNLVGKAFLVKILNNDL